jgi:hypothetical protein
LSYQIAIPTLHADQVRAWDVISANRFTAVRCGRRWGKTDLDKTIACDAAVKGHPVGWFAPEYKFIAEAYAEITEILSPLVTQSSLMSGVTRLLTGGRIDYWSLDNERAGRSRKYKWVVIDEGAFTKPNMVDVWERSIKPTLLDLSGKCVVTSNTNGIDPTNFLWAVCNAKNEDGTSKYGFAEFHAPSTGNPLIPMRLREESEDEWQARRKVEFDKLIADNHPLVYQQEYLAEFVDWRGTAFFSHDSLTEDKLPVAMPMRCDALFAIIDTAVKTGQANDGTAVIYFGLYRVPRGSGYRLVVLDYDLQQIEGALLETWLPTVFENLKGMAAEVQCIGGIAGVWIEDKASGMVLLQQARRRGIPAQAIDSKLTAVGKDERAISVSGYVYRGLVKISKRAYDRVLTYKGTAQNHLISQITQFRVGDKDAAKRADDLLDCFTYGIAMGLGDSGGF